MINAGKLGDMIVSRVKKMSEAHTFRFLASLYNYTDYEGGRETFASGADCSGAVCGPLLLMGYNIRTTADELYRKIFTIPVSSGMMESDDYILAVFFTAETQREHFGKIVPAGHVVHVAPVVGRYTVLHAHGEGTPNRIVTTAYLHYIYEKMRCRDEWRAIDRTALIRHHLSGDMAWSIDAEIHGLIK